MRKFGSMIVWILVASGFLFLQSCSSATGKPQHAKNIIFMIGDGMGLHQVFAAMTVNGDSLSLEQTTSVGLQKTQSADDYITDSAASGTAMACGKKTKNGRLGIDPDGHPLESILKVAEKRGMATGLVSTSAITHATPAAFIANQVDRNNYEAIAEDFLKTDIDVFIGGGYDHFAHRDDGRDLTGELAAKGYTVTQTLDECMKVTSGKLAGFTAPVHNPATLDGRDDMLPLATKKALELLSRNKKGFFVMIEGSQIDWGGHANDQDYVISETLDFDRAVKVALDFAKADGNTLVVITADHETGGMIILDGDMDAGTVKTVFTTGGHTGIMLPVYSYGPDADLFTGIYQNTAFKARFMEALGITEQAD